MATRIPAAIRAGGGLHGWSPITASAWAYDISEAKLAQERTEPAEPKERGALAHSSGTSAPIAEKGTRRTSAQSPTRLRIASTTLPVLCQ